MLLKQCGVTLGLNHGQRHASNVVQDARGVCHFFVKRSCTRDSRWR